MAGSFYGENNDSMDIKELAALNDDISDDLIEQLQQQLTGNITSASAPAVNPNDDSTLFEEAPVSAPESPADSLTPTEASVPAPVEQPPVKEEAPKKEEINVNKNFDDNFIKKYKAKLNKKAKLGLNENKGDISSPEPVQEAEETSEPIENLSQGNISERPLTQDMKNYNESLDFLDGNVKYSKYVIYIDPQNVDFIDGLTVKERKNLINGILRQQDDIAITKQRFKIMQTIIRHVIVAVLTVTIAIPVIYYAINASLEATIDNHRRSQSNWQTLYKEHGKITQN